MIGNFHKQQNDGGWLFGRGQQSPGAGNRPFSASLVDLFLLKIVAEILHDWFQAR
jgi:hypothetical protein